MKSSRKSSPKKYLVALVVALGIFLLPQMAHAATFAFNNKDDPFTAKVTTTPNTAAIAITFTNPNKLIALSWGGTIAVYKEKNGAADTDSSIYKKYYDVTSNPITANPTAINSFSLNSLDDGTNYYLAIGATTYKFTTDINLYSLSLAQENQTTNAYYFIPSTETRVLSISILKNNSLVLQLPTKGAQTPSSYFAAGWTAGLPPGSKVYSLDIGDTTKDLGLDLYQVELTALNNNGTQDIVYGPVPFSLRSNVLVGGTSTTNDYQWPLTYNLTDNPPTIVGKVNVTLHPDYQNMKVTVIINHDPLFLSTTNKTLANIEVKADGSYSVPIGTLTLNPSEVYYIKHDINSAQSKVDEKTDQFVAGQKYVPQTVSNIQADYEKRSYRLLSPLPGLSVLLDPDLCIQQFSQGKLPTGAICDINAFINYILKLLIAVAAVFLVLRIMYEGYVVITTDIPYLKTSSKNGLLQAVGGLVLALSGYVILNTINPQLVQNTINLNAVTVAGNLSTNVSDTTFQKITGGPALPADQYVTLAKQAAATAGVDPCLIMTVITHESGWNPKDISCDATALSDGIPSRTAFIASGINSDGTPLPAGATVTTAHVVPACTWSDTTPGYGIDWRFSVGFGLTQQTVYPSPYSDTSAYLTAVKNGGSLFVNRFKPEAVPLDPKENNDFQLDPSKNNGFQLKTVQDFINHNLSPLDNINKGIQELKSALSASGCNMNDVTTIFKHYGAGSCNSSGAFITKESAARAQTYQYCKQNNANLTAAQLNKQHDIDDK